MVITISVRGTQIQQRPNATLQWAPTLTVHDPNPPITLEDAAAAAGQPFYIRDSYALPDFVSAQQS